MYPNLFNLVLYIKEQFLLTGNIQVANIRASLNINFQGAVMKILDKVELVVKLKERIEDAKKQNSAMAEQLQKLLENILKSGQYKAV